MYIAVRTKLGAANEYVFVQNEDTLTPFNYHSWRKLDAPNIGGRMQTHLGVNGGDLEVTVTGYGFASSGTENPCILVRDDSGRDGYIALHLHGPGRQVDTCPSWGVDFVRIAPVY